MKDLPGISSLAYDYYYAYDKVREFFSGDFRDLTSYARQAENVRSRYLPREKLSEILKESNLRYGCGAPTLRNIQKLVEDKACAVVTGQQTGLFSGPLYTIFKALTAIRLAEYLSREKSGTCVPVFWLASNDHDFAEIDHINLLDKENRIKAIQYRGPSTALKSPVSQVVLSQDSSDCIRQLEELTHDSEFKPEILSQLRDAYRPGQTYVEAFARWMTRLFQSYGLIFIDPEHPGLKDLGKDVFYSEIAQNSPSTQGARETSQKLDQKNYPTQVPQREGILNVFLVDGERRSIRVEDNGYRIKGKTHTYSKDELLQLVEKEPHTFSPNVLLRPLFQDTLLPTIAYVGGTSEVAYFAQMKDVYRSFNLPMPVIYPRKSLTLIEKTVDKTLQTYSLKVEDIWRDADEKINGLAKQQFPPSLTEVFQITTSHINRDLADIKREIQAFDPVLEKTVDQTVRKIRHQLSLLEAKTLQASKKRNIVLMNRLNLAKNSLYPNRHLQERVFNITPFLFKYGFALIDRLYEAVDITHDDHQVINL